MDFSLSYFGEMLGENYNLNKTAEKMWDLRAAQYSLSQQKDNGAIVNSVMEILSRNGLLEGNSVLDIGGGAGRYAIPIARRAKEVVMTDLSSNMLEHARSNARQVNADNISYFKLDWDNADIRELGWEKRFDVAFASMCPSLRSQEGLEKMMAVSRQWCHINQFIQMEDTVASQLLNMFHASQEYDPHNDREFVQMLFNYLWLRGYHPVIAYAKDERKLSYSVEDAAAHYGGRFGGRAAKLGIDLKSVLAGIAEKGVIETESHTTLAAISWHI